MKRRHVLLGSVSAAFVSARAEQVAPMPTFNVGDTWTFNDLSWIGEKQGQFMEKVEQVTADQIILSGFTRAGKPFTDGRVTLEFNALIRTGEGDKRNSVGLVKFPMSVGSRWDVQFRDRNGPQNLTRKVERIESVRVPAGEFECFAIESSGIWNNVWYNNNGQVVEAYWYSPVAKRVVKYEVRFWGKGGASAVGRSIQYERKWELAEYKLV